MVPPKVPLKVAPKVTQKVPPKRFSQKWGGQGSGIIYAAYERKCLKKEEEKTPRLLLGAKNYACAQKENLPYHSFHNLFHLPNQFFHISTRFFWYWDIFHGICPGKWKFFKICVWFNFPVSYHLGFFYFGFFLFLHSLFS